MEARRGREESKADRMKAWSVGVDLAGRRWKGELEWVVILDTIVDDLLRHGDRDSDAGDWIVRASARVQVRFHVA